MNKTLKISLIALVGCLALVGLGAWYASSFINPAQVTKLLSSSVKDATGRELKVAGPVSLSLFPSISVKAEQVSLSNASWASNPDMFVFKHIELDIRILPLLKGNVEISRIGIRGLEANLQTNKTGEGNWNIAPPTIVAVGSATQSASSDSSSNALVSIKTVDVVDARINYQDGEKVASPINIPKLSLDGGDGISTILVDIQRANYTLNLKGKTSSLRNAYFAWNQATANLDLDLILTLNGKSLAITGDIDKKPGLLPKFNINLNSKSFDLAPLVGSVVVAGSGGKTSQAATHKTQGRYLFSDDALPFDLLPLADGSINMNIAELGIPHQAPFTNFKTTLQFQKDRIDASDVSFSIGKGSAQRNFPLLSSPALRLGFL